MRTILCEHIDPEQGYDVVELTKSVAKLQALIKDKDAKITQLQARVKELEAVAVFDPVESGR